MISARFDEGTVPPRLCLEGLWTITHAAAARDALLVALNRELSAPCEVDLSAVQEIDTAGVQLLVALARCLRETGTAARLCGLAPVVHRVAAALGAADEQQCFGWPLPASDSEAVASARGQLELTA